MGARRSAHQSVLPAGLVEELATTNTVRLVADIAVGDIVAYLLGSSRLTFAPVLSPGWRRSWSKT